MGGKRIKFLTALLGAVVWCGMTKAAPMGTNFTYQGQLKSGGSPVTDTCDFEFSLWDAVTSGNQRGSTVAVSAVPVVNGLFSVELDFGVAVFNSEARWLEVAVRCPTGTGSYVPLDPREPISAAPYSLQTRGIYVDGSGNVGIGTTSPGNPLHVETSGERAVYGKTTGLLFPAYGVVGESRSVDGRGVLGVATAAGGATYGVQGTNASPDGAGVRGEGVTGVSGYSTSGVGVRGVHSGGGTFPGVWGETDSTSTGASAIRGDANATSGQSYGVLGKSSSASGIGIYGENSSGGTAISGVGGVGVRGAHSGSGTFPGVWGETDSTSTGASGVRGFATATSGQSYGVLGKSSSASGIGIYGENSSGGTAISAVGNGSFREQATLRVENTQSNAGMAAYIKSQGSWATMHVENDSTGEVLWLQRNDSDAPFIVARNATTGQDVFRVSGSGYTKVSVLQITGGADLAEGFDISPLETVDADGRKKQNVPPRPGMVVSIDPDHPGQLSLSHKPYDPTVAGIISGAGGVKTGMLMHHSGTIANGQFPVALSGRVYCLCDTSNGPIRPGDLLTTSSQGGYAMKVTDRDRAAGAIIGKAMTPLTQSSGFVLVLVGLQ